MKAELKLGWIVFFLVPLPLGISLFLAHEGKHDALELYLALGVILSIMLIKPLAHYLGNVIFMREIREMNRYCLSVKQGDYTTKWNLPDEEEEEHELMQLKRNLYWMVHAISSREDWLQSRLSETTENMQKYERMSYVDGLTRIYNRRFFDVRIVELAQQAAESGAGMFLMMVDCDGFKEVNDTYGHQEGDELLIRLAGLLRSMTREGVDYAFRYGGDEFGVLFMNATRETVVAVGERIRRGFREKAVGHATLSIGVAEYRITSEPMMAVDAVKIAADQAVYAAKSAGKDSVVAAWAVEGRSQ